MPPVFTPSAHKSRITVRFSATHWIIVASMLSYHSAVTVQNTLPNQLDASEGVFVLFVSATFFIGVDIPF
jgi:hypothetical protein